ncbi:DnaJ C-terminal domain-containing protein [Thiobacillus sp.]|uniref:DnaJ C-terminal domain-containing protein n=1 Tax=Thiobacillus sp. TaxID=924 RepID=UPI0025E5E5B9|nr:DnaJ C-terminal domain-containing protein [Thiobacillus sp.]MBT9541147.1 DnaJ domain-containing protein [Thiobacillus sp.]
MKFKDYYAVFGVPRDATQDDIKRAYRKLARQYHPDVSKDPDADVRFKELGEAYAVLKDPEKRAAYDQVGSQWKAGQDFQPPPDWDAGFEFSGRDFGAGADPGHSDFFEALFGRRARGGQRPGMHARGQDHHAKVLIDLEDAYRGVQRSISLRMPVPDEHGRVVLRERKLDVRIPKGIRAGQHLRLAGQGEPGVGEGPPGDLFLEIEFKPHAQFRVIGPDVYLDLPLAPWEAALGCSLTVPTPEGSVQLTVPAGSAAGRQLRLKGKGIPGKTPGDLYAVLAIVLPPAVNEDEKAAYRAMAEAFDFNARAPMKG